MHFSARQTKATEAPSHDEASRSPTRPMPAKHPLNYPLLKLQQSIGNQGVQRLLHSQQVQGLRPSQGRLLQRKCACGGTPGVDGECAECRNRRMQRSSANQGEHSEAPSIVHEVLSSPAEPLDVGTREFMEPRFGHDFSKVRVHSDAKSAESARVLNAQAYTVGQDLVFGAEQYAPDTHTGQHLLAHELAHVVQQARGGTSTPPMPDSTLERAAEQAASALSQGSGWIRVAGATARGLARQPTLGNPARDPSILSTPSALTTPEVPRVPLQPTGEATISGGPGALLAGAANI
jgi:Domain of unknown function (DUF4157)